MAVKGIWANSFKSGGVILGTPFKNGVQSKVGKSSINTTQRATIAYSLTAAIAALVFGRCSVGKTSNGYWCECKSSKIPDRRYVINYNPTLNCLEAFVTENGQDIKFDLVTDKFAHWSIFVPRIVQLVSENPGGEFEVNYTKMKKEYEQTNSISRSNSIEMFILNDYLYESRHEYIEDCSEVKVIHSKEELLSKDVSELFSVSKNDFTFGVFNTPKTSAATGTSSTTAAPRKKRGKKPTKASFELDWKTPLDDEDKKLIPDFDLSVMKISNGINKLTHMVKEEINSEVSVRNIILYGEAGAGKSTGAKIMAQLWGLPYRFLNLSLNSEESDMVGTFRPKADGTFEFFKPAFAETYEKGGVIELMEVNYARPGALGVLNSALDDTAMITLGNGDIIKRHPNCIIMATTNVDYAGCQKMNEALKDRFQEIQLIDKLPNDDLVDITCRNSGNTDRSLVAKMVDAVQKISIKMVEEQITGGVCSTRQLANWARDVKYTNNIIESAKSTILPGVALDVEVQRDIIDTVLKPMF